MVAPRADAVAVEVELARVDIVHAVVHDVCDTVFVPIRPAPVVETDRTGFTPLLLRAETAELTTRALAVLKHTLPCISAGLPRSAIAMGPVVRADPTGCAELPLHQIPTAGAVGRPAITVVLTPSAIHRRRIRATVVVPATRVLHAWICVLRTVTVGLTLKVRVAGISYVVLVHVFLGQVGDVRAVVFAVPPGVAIRVRVALGLPVAHRASTAVRVHDALGAPVHGPRPFELDAPVPGVG